MPILPVDRTSTASLPFLEGGGEMGELIRAFDWSKTTIGVPENWPQVLKHMVSMMLNSNFPTLICWGENYIQLYNDKFRPINGRSKHPDALGGSARNTYSEIWDTIGPMFTSVMNGESLGFPDFMVPLDRNGYVENCYFDFSYSPIKDDQGEIGGVLVVCVETTAKVKSLAAITESESKFRNIIDQAPVAIAIFQGPEFIIETYNDKVLEYWGRTAEQVAGKPLFKALPEASGQGFEELLSNVLKTGERFIARELPVTLIRNGVLETTWINFIYDPIKDLQGNITGIIVVCNEVTDQFNSRKELENAKDKLQLSIAAAELGTFDMDLHKGTMDWDARCRELFGISHQDMVSYEHDFTGGLHPEDRERVLNYIGHEVMNKAVSNGRYDIEYRTIGVEDQKLRWLRAKGQVYFDKNDVPQRFTGAVIDITEQKADDQRKNDFIGMVSHELKTPLTSLTAIVQVLNAKLKGSEDPFVPSALEKTNLQVKKMTTLINGFLNISRLESGKMLIEKKDFDLTDLIKDVIDENLIIYAGHEIGFEPCGPVTINADRDKIGSVISNLISNAVKYSPKGKQIIIDCTKTNKLVKVSISDQGMGIKGIDLPHVFNRYFRAQTNHSQHISGFGIGLYLCWEIIKQHNGDISVESKSDVGSTFTFTLPLT